MFYDCAGGLDSVPNSTMSKTMDGADIRRDCCKWSDSVLYLLAQLAISIIAMRLASVDILEELS